MPAGSGSEHGVVTLWNALMANEDVMPVGLGARDSLRLEAQYEPTPTGPLQPEIEPLVAHKQPTQGVARLVD